MQYSSLVAIWLIGGAIPCFGFDAPSPRGRRITLEKAFLEKPSVEEAAAKSTASEFERFLKHIRADGNKDCVLSDRFHSRVTGIFKGGAYSNPRGYEYRISREGDTWWVHLKILFTPGRFMKMTTPIDGTVCKELFALEPAAGQEDSPCFVDYSSRNIDMLLGYWEKRARGIWDAASPDVRFDFVFSREAADSEHRTELVNDPKMDFSRTPDFFYTGMTGQEVAHELGHIMGLDDEYNNGSGAPASASREGGCNGSFLMCSHKGRPIPAYVDHLLLRAFCKENDL